jgi:hypothetical protein
MTRPPRLPVLAGLLTVGVLCALLGAAWTAWQAPATPDRAPAPAPRITTDEALGLKEGGAVVKDMLKARRIADDNALFECVTVQQPALRGCKDAITPSVTRGETEIDRPGRNLEAWTFTTRWQGADIVEWCDKLEELDWRKERDVYIEKRKRRMLGYSAIRTTGAGVGPIAQATRRPRRCRKPPRPRPDCRPRQSGGGIVCGVSPRARTHARETELVA